MPLHGYLCFSLSEHCTRYFQLCETNDKLFLGQYFWRVLHFFSNTVPRNTPMFHFHFLYCCFARYSFFITDRQKTKKFYHSPELSADLLYGQKTKGFYLSRYLYSS